MNVHFEFPDPGPTLQNSEQHTALKDNAVLEDFETRLQHLENRLQDLDIDSRLVFLKSGPHVFDAVLDLRVKVDAVRWMLRVARHVDDPGRARIFMTVANSIDQLEDALETELSAA